MEEKTRKQQRRNIRRFSDEKLEKELSFAEGFAQPVKGQTPLQAESELSAEERSWLVELRSEQADRQVP